jgi:hypothetical protein
MAHLNRLPRLLPGDGFLLCPHTLACRGLLCLGRSGLSRWLGHTPLSLLCLSLQAQFRQRLHQCGTADQFLQLVGRPVFHLFANGLIQLVKPRFENPQRRFALPFSLALLQVLL